VFATVLRNNLQLDDTRNMELNDDERELVAAMELNPQKASVLSMLGLTRTSDTAAIQKMFTIY
jgi:L-asparaginase